MALNIHHSSSSSPLTSHHYASSSGSPQHTPHPPFPPLRSNMLPRNERSIFYLGEEAGDDIRGVDHSKTSIDIHQHLGAQNHGHQQRREREADVRVGLQILVQHQHYHTRPCHIVLKQMVWPPARQYRHPCSFLRSCYLCRRKLSLHKDVYMYRGNQGFCSEECRRQQILTDEARENEAMIKSERKGLAHQRRHHGPRPAIRGSPRRLMVIG